MKNLGILSVPTATANPASPANGDVWYNGTTGRIRLKENNIVRTVTDRNQIRLSAQGFITENYPMMTCTASSAVTSGTVYFYLMGFFEGEVISNVHVVSAAVAVSSTGAYAAIYDTAGNRLAISSNLTTTFDSGTGIKSLPLSYTITAEGAYYIAIINVAGTGVTLFRGENNTLLGGNLATFAKAGGQQTGQTTPPTSATIVSSGFGFWMAVS